MTRFTRSLLVALAFCALVVLLLPTSAGALVENAPCLSCHETMGNASFGLDPVDKATVCDACHLDSFVGTHPRHNQGGNCGACHPGFGQSLASAVPSVLLAGGAFAAPTSPDLPAYVIHTIHATPRWPKSVRTTTSKCASCHNTVGCTACHGDLVDLTHALHGSGSPTSSIGATWTGDVSLGIIASEAEDTLLVAQPVYCGAPGCHDTSGVVEGQPGLQDCYNHGAIPTSNYLANTVTRVGSWSLLSGGMYSLGREVVSNYDGARIELSFTGERVSLVSTKDPYRGIGRVFIDNVDMGTFDQYNLTSQFQRIVWTSPELEPGTHTLSVRPTGTKRAAARATYVGLDNIQVHLSARDSVARPCADCHLPQTAPTHGNMDHGFTAISAYDNVTQTGCANSGAGCHASGSTGDAVNAFHESGKVSCLASGCHTSPTMDAAWKTAGATANCIRCHDGNFVNGINQPNNAVDATPLVGAPPNGHYSETTHTAAGMGTAVTGIGGGSYSATCTDCHNPVSATYVDGFYAQHQGLGGGLGDTTCADCHSATAGTAAVVTDETRTDNCTDCHNATALPGKAQHSAPVAPAVAGIADGCVASGCHATNNLHALHANNTNATPNGCFMTDCHVAGTQGIKPTAKACGSAGDCHTGTPIHPTEAAAHTTLASGACSVCHESGDLKIVHADQCGLCHGNLSYPTLPGSGVNLECTDCHGDEVGLHDYTPIEFNHYTGTEATHTADAQAGTVNGWSCVTCHKMEMKPEHYKSSTDTGTLSGYSNTCIGCHEAKVDGFGPYPSWGNTCDECHATKHAGMATDHDATAVGAGCGGGSCHDITDVGAIHNNSASAVTQADTDTCTTCHDNNDTLPTTLTCTSAGCHTGGHSHGLEAAQSGGCYNSGAGCHPTSTLDYAADYHPSSGCAEGACHTAANHNDAAFNNPVGCLECHDAQYNNAPDVVPTETAHYIEATHTATAMDTLVGGYSFNNACSNCHTDKLKSAHNTTTVGTVICADCHNDETLGSRAQVKVSNWATDTCDDCHTTKHTTYTLGTHTATGSGCTLSAGCHNYDGDNTLDVRALHDGTGVGCTATGTDNKGSSSACHAVDTPMTAGALTCGDTGACHTNHLSDNHGGDHGYDAASNYTQTADTVGSEAGCTNSDAGCHASAATGDAVGTFHVAVKTGCTSTDACHSDAEFGPTWDTGTGANCSRCHGGATDPGIGGDNAPLYEAASAGHYGETTHTATGMDATVNAGGTGSAACSSCHSSGYRDAHGAANGGTGSYGTSGTYVTCSECHNYGAGTQLMVSDAVRDDQCSDCHRIGTGLPPVQHGSPSAATGTTTVTDGCVQAEGCHTTMNLHALHKDITCAGVDENGAVCHTAANMDRRPTQNGCGGTASANGPCHAGYAWGSHASRGGKDCYWCHEDYDNAMEDGADAHSVDTSRGAPNHSGTIRTSSYHHVLGGGGFDGDEAFLAGAYPASQTNVYCMSCHVDHDKFNSNKAQNLRASLGVEAGANSDFNVPTSTDYNATTFTDTSGDWTNDANSTGAADNIVAASASDNVFEGRHSFTLPATFDNASLTVRSRANGLWGQSGTLPDLLNQSSVHFPTGDGAKSASGWTYSTGTIAWSLLNEDPINGTNRMTSALTNGLYVQLTYAAPSIPSNATNIRVNVTGYTRKNTSGSGTACTYAGRLRVGGTDYAHPTPQSAGLSAYDPQTFTWTTNPRTSAAWTPADVNGTSANPLQQYGMVTSNVTGMALRLADMRMEILYDIVGGPYNYDDTWAIQYSTNAGTSWSDVVATNATAEGALTDHTIDLTGILTPANRANFLVRIVGSAVGAADNANTIEWDSSTVAVSSGTNAQVCMSCHTVALTKDATNQKTFAAPPSTVTPALSVANYGSSSHDFGVNSTFNGGTTFSANCSKCHNDEQTKSYQTSTNKFGTHWSAERRVLAAMGITVADPLAEETECYRCHSTNANGFKSTTNQDWYGATAMNAASQAIYGLFGSTYKHNVAGYIGIHANSAADETQAYISANKHVECGDCHGVHAAATGSHPTAATSSNVISNVLKGATGVNATFSATKWTAPTAYSQVDPAQYEWQICFKCHSGANTNVTSWGGAGAASWTDQGLEFSPSNGSYHPVVAALPTARRLTAGTQMANSWTVGRTMYCSDCHAQSTTGSLGPHGSAIKWMLKGPNQAWPYTTAAANGTNATTNYRLLSASETNIGTSNGLFCRNCHIVNIAQDYHAGRTEHTAMPCVSCHIRVPHGGKVARLIAANGNATAYPGNLPTRYTANGAGSNAGVGWITGFNMVADETAYADTDCGWASNAACTSDHPSANGTDRW